MRLIRSFGYAISGIRKAIVNERNMQIHISISIFVIVAAIFFQIDSVEWIFCILSIGMVLGAEMFNSAIERVVDMISPEKSTLAGLIKDMSAGAVFLFSAISLIIGIIIFLPKILHYFI